MSENGSARTPRHFGRRALTAVAVLGIAATGAAWSGCGDDEVDEAQQEAEEAAEEGQEQAEEIGEEAQEQGEEIGEEAEQQIEEGTEEAQEGAEDEGGSGGGSGAYGN